MQRQQLSKGEERYGSTKKGRKKTHSGRTAGKGKETGATGPTAAQIL
jgi:hypothetical protein